MTHVCLCLIMRFLFVVAKQICSLLRRVEGKVSEEQILFYWKLWQKSWNKYSKKLSTFFQNSDSLLFKESFIKTTETFLKKLKNSMKLFVYFSFSDTFFLHVTIKFTSLDLLFSALPLCMKIFSHFPNTRQESKVSIKWNLNRIAAASRLKIYDRRYFSSLLKSRGAQKSHSCFNWDLYHSKMTFEGTSL